MSREVWRHISFAEAVDINPKRSLQTGTVVPYVEMAAVPAEGATIEYLLEREAGGGGAKFQNGDTLFARITPCAENGKTAFVDCLPAGAPGLGSTELIVFGPKPEVTHPEYVYHLARSELVRGPAISQMVGTTGRARVPNTVFDEIAIPLPPLHEQRRIAEILSSVDEAIAATRAVIEQTRKVKQGLLECLLTNGIGHVTFKHTEIGNIPEGWEVVQVSNVAASIDSGWSPDCEKVAATDEQWGVLKTSAVVWDGYQPDENKKLPDSMTPRPEIEVKAGDVLITRAGPVERTGVVALVENTPGKLMLSDKIIRIQTKADQCLPGFLSLWLSSPRAQNEIVKKKSGMAQSQTNISQKALRALFVPLPALSEQIAIANAVRSFDSSISSECAKLDTLKNTKSALMSDLLTGRKRAADALPMAAE